MIKHMNLKYINHIIKIYLKYILIKLILLI